VSVLEALKLAKKKGNNNAAGTFINRWRNRLIRDDFGSHWNSGFGIGAKIRRFGAVYVLGSCLAAALVPPNGGHIRGKYHPLSEFYDLSE
jgi:hypothetical protein